MSPVEVHFILGSVSGPDPDRSGFFADPDPGLKVWIRPLINLWDLNDGLIRFWLSLTKKGKV